MHHASVETLGGNVTSVGASMLGRSVSAPNAAQVDLVAIERDSGGRAVIRAIGEAKHRNRPTGIGELRRLELFRDRLDAPDAKLMLGCDAGFDRELLRLDRSPSDTELVDADRLLHGSQSPPVSVRLAIMDIAVTGASGLIGSALCRRLEADGHPVIRFVRRTPGANEAQWDPAGGTIDAAALEGIGAVVHLAGAGIGDKRWTPSRKRELVESRTLGTKLMATALAGLQQPPTVLVSASAVGWYGPRGDEELTEDSERGGGFLSDLCRDWEAATEPAEAAGIRVVHARTGIVLTSAGGALRKLLPLFKLGLGGRTGSGHQFMSCISLHDEVSALVHLIRDESLRGAVNLTGPTPVTNLEFTRALGAAVRRPAIFPVPVFAPKLLLGAELVDNLLLTGQRVFPNRLLASGFPFKHPTVATQLGASLSQTR